MAVTGDDPVEQGPLIIEGSDAGEVATPFLSSSTTRIPNTKWRTAGAYLYQSKLRHLVFPLSR